MADINPEVLKAVPGAAGSLLSMLFIKDTWPRRLGLFCGGAATAYFGGAWAAKFTGLDQGFAGFLLGLLGMMVFAKVVESWNKFDASGLLIEWIRKIAGLPQKES